MPDLPIGKVTVWFGPQAHEETWIGLDRATLASMTLPAALRKHTRRRRRFRS